MWQRRLSRRSLSPRRTGCATVSLRRTKSSTESGGGKTWTTRKWPPLRSGWQALLLAVRQTEHKQFLAHRRSVAHELSVSRSSEAPRPGPVPSSVPPRSETPGPGPVLSGVMVSRRPESPVLEVMTTDDDSHRRRGRRVEQSRGGRGGRHHLAVFGGHLRAMEVYRGFGGQAAKARTF